MQVELNLIPARLRKVCTFNQLKTQAAFQHRGIEADVINKLPPLLPPRQPRGAAASWGRGGKPLPYLSEVQLAICDPLAEAQFWHKDNAAHGLTVLVPLTNMPLRRPAKGSKVQGEMGI